MKRFRGRLYKTDRARDFDHEQDRVVRMRQIYETIDRQKFQWIVVFVAGVGFFLDGYTLFASNMALPMIDYVYWQTDTSTTNSTAINISTLAGTLFGQLLFGFLADKNGRKKMYGVELLLLITSTLGVAMASTGVHDSMSIFSWLIFWRIMVGIGVGGDYPLSAVITSEFAPTKHRSRMLATVFFMQPLGQVAGNVVSLIVIAASRSQGDADLVRTVDIMWRWVIGIGSIPGVIALLFRIAIPETPRFLLEIDDDPVKAEFDATTLFTNDIPKSPSADERGSWGTGSAGFKIPGVEDGFPAGTEFTIQPATLNAPWRLAKADIVQYFWTEGNWRALLGTSLCWLLVDFGFYGIGLSSPQFLADVWGSLHLSKPAPPWQTDDRPGANLYDQFEATSIHAMIILNVGSVAGGLLLILFVNKIDRTSLQLYGFLLLAALFVALGITFITTQEVGTVAIVLYVFGQMLFNFGPNSTTYMIPAEIFPTRYRATCHGISAASGKLGSIIVQIFSTYYKFGTQGTSQIIRYGWILVVFAVAMLLGAGITYICIPPIQKNNEGRGKLWDGEPETLENLALGRMGPASRYATTINPGTSAVRNRNTLSPRTASFGDFQFDL